MANTQKKVHIVGAGLAGSECAFQLAQKGYQVVLFEMRKQTMTPAHKTGKFAELVCSNSFGSSMDYSAPGQLKWEAEKMGSLILQSAHEAAVPAGMALGVDRELFSQIITEKIQNHPNIEICNQLINDLNSIPRPCVIATGPLTHHSLANSMQNHFDNKFLYFFDAIAPIIDTDSIDMNIAWMGDRWDKGNNDYINCPLNKEQYFQLIEEIKTAKKVEAKEFEKDIPFFEGCMPIEEIVRRGDLTLRFGPLSPKGLRDPKTGKNHFAVVQLRQDNKAATAYNMVGFQTKMTYGEQTRIFKMIPGLEQAEFLKLGSIHRNLYIDTPKKLSPILSSQKDAELYFAGQITGVEGYFESTCIGLLIAQILHQQFTGHPLNLPPRESALGSLLNAITEEKENFQPTNINFSLFPELIGEIPHGRRNREARREAKLDIARKSFTQWLKNLEA